MRFISLACALLVACSTDTFVSDGGTDAAPNESSASDAVAGDASSSRFCAPGLNPPAFCMDFDDGDLTSAFEKGQAVTIKTPTVTGGMSSVGADGVNGTGDAHLATDAMSNGGATEYADYIAVLSSNGVVFSPVVGSATLRFSLRLDNYPAADGGTTAGTAFSELGSITLTDSNNTSTKLSCGIGIDANAELFLNMDGVAPVVVALPQTGEWHDFVLTMTMSANAALEVKVDKVSIGTVKSTNPPTFTTPKANFNVGLSTQPPFGLLAIRLDNVSFDSL